MPNLLAEIRSRFSAALDGMTDDIAAAVELVRPSQDEKFGDYQANCAMPLAKQLGKSPRDVAGEIIAKLQLDNLCETPEVAGPGFINLRLKANVLKKIIEETVLDERLGVRPITKPRTFVIDYSAPNVAKPMHVGHIRSTAIGDSLARILRFLGHRVIGDNHLGDWGTQFGMIFYGYRNFLDADAYQASPVQELARLYRLVRQLMDFHDAVANLPKVQERLARREEETEQATDKKQKKKLAAGLPDLRDEVASLQNKIANVSDNPDLFQLAEEHRHIGQHVLEETAKLHAGDAENLRLWHEFMPCCLEDIEKIYRRLDITFDVTLGESFYHDQLPSVVEELKAKGLARESEGAMCIFLEGHAAPFLIQKSDGAFLYATSDLATIRYRMKTWQPDAILYVVDHRQSLHFEHLFAAARLWGYDQVELNHISFGTVLGEDGRPFRTRAGDTVGLESLLDEAVAKALEEVRELSRDLPPESQAEVAEAVGIGAIKYADLSQNRTNDYQFSLTKMVSTTGNTATYMQYAYARCRSILIKSEQDVDALRGKFPLLLDTPAERALAMELLRFSEALDLVTLDYRPNQLTSYLWTLSNKLSAFYEACPVIKPPPPEAIRNSRLLLCDLTARVLKQGLQLLGIRVVEKM